MIAESSPTLSESIGLARRARPGGRLRTWYGQSGQSYLFNAVPFETLANYRSIVAILAEPAADGRLFAWSAALVDAAGMLHAADESWPGYVPTGSIAFVHFLAESDQDVQSLIDDLFPQSPLPELNLAA